MDRIRLNAEDIIETSPKSVYELIVEAIHEARRNNIKADSIVINKNLVKVPERFGEYPTMICGLKLYNTSCDLPDDYLFAVLQDNSSKTNADRIRAMTDNELSDFLCGIAYAGEEKWREPFMREFCDKCPTVEGVVTETGQKMKFHECDFKDGKCPHGSDILWWLKQPAEVEDERKAD